MKVNRGLLAGAGALLLALGVGLAQVSPLLNPPRWDEFIVVYDAHRVVTGQVPYRDFFNFIPPGIFLALAAAFKVTGSSTLTLGRYVSLAGMAGTFLLLAVALRRRGWSLCPACLWAAVIPVSLYGFWAVPSHHWLAAACAAGMMAALGWNGSRPAGAWFAAGISAGLAGTFVQTSGLALASLGFALAALSPAGKKRAIGAVAAGIGAVWGALLLWIAFVGAGGSFFRDVLLWPVRNYSRGGNENAGAILQDLPWRLGDLWQALLADPSVSRAVVTAAGFALYVAVLGAGIALVACSATTLVRLLRARRIAEPLAACALLASALLGGLAAAGNANWLHLVYLMAILGPVWLVALGDWSAWAAWPRRIGAGLLGALLACGALYHTRGLWFHRPSGWEFTDVDRAVREQPINRWLRSPGTLNPGDTIAAFPEGGEVYLYSAPAAVGYTYFRPLSERYHSAEDHAVVAAQLESKAPRFVLVPPDMERDYLDPASPVAAVLTSRYDRNGVVGNAVVYGLRTRSPSAAPAGGPAR